MSDFQFVFFALTTAYVLGWAFGATIQYFKKFMEISA